MRTHREHNPVLKAALISTLLLFGTACSDDTQANRDSGLDARRSEGGAKEGGSDGTFPNLKGGNPLVPEVAAYPFPSDFYLKKSTTTKTGRSVSLPAEALPKFATPEMFADADGFSRIPVILAYLPGGVDPKSLPSATDHQQTLAATSPAFLVEEKTWKKVPILVENDLTARKDSERALIIRPLIALAPNRGYVVILRDRLKAFGGKAHRANAAFRALRDNTPTSDPAIEAQREDFKLVNQAIAGLKLDPKTVVLAWSFHTRSESQGVDTLVKMTTLANRATVDRYTIISNKVETKGTVTNRQIVASFKAPNFIGNDGLINRDTNGDPKQDGTRDVSFGITIPKTVDGPRPVILYGHGFFGSWIQGTRGTINAICQRFKFSTVSTNIGFNEDIEPMTMKALMGNLPDLKKVVAEVQQNLANFTAIANLVKGKLATDLTVDRGQGKVKVFDGKSPHYMGISNGGTFGYLVAATSPDIERAAILVGGGGLIHFLERAVQWNEYGPLLRLIYPHPRERQLVLSLLQMVLDPVDSMNYAAHLIKNRFAGRKRLRAAFLMAVNDSQVRNLVTEWVMRTADIPLAMPSPKVVFGLRQVKADPPDGNQTDPAVLFVYDEHVEPSPTTNLPPKKDNKTHQTTDDLPHVRKQLGTFLETGKLIQFCSGACDPD